MTLSFLFLPSFNPATAILYLTRSFQQAKQVGRYLKPQPLFN